MRSHQLELVKYNTDKVQHGYLRIYDPVFSEHANREINLLELGILDGGSLLLQIFGIDLKAPVWLNDEERIKVFSGSQEDKKFLTEVAKNALGGFDIIIDDASHVGKLTQISFWHLFENHLKPGGIYVIEDWGDWPDGEVYKSVETWDGKCFHTHSAGMMV